tara:strand:+ start:131 stop:289 length:159 start_codon:yes stop_codon:yes gene_type:complete
MTIKPFKYFIIVTHILVICYGCKILKKKKKCDCPEWSKKTEKQINILRTNII